MISISQTVIVTKDFKKFLQHVVMVSTAFQMLDSKPKPRSETGKLDCTGRHGGNSEKGRKSKTVPEKRGTTKKGSGSSTAPPCPHGPCKAKVLRRWLRDCEDATKTERASLLAEVAVNKAKTGPSKSTRSQVFGGGSDASSQSSGRRKIGRLPYQKSLNHTVSFSSPACPITLLEGLSSVNGTGRCDDGSDDSLVSPRLVEQAALKGIGKLTAIEPIGIRVALKQGEDVQGFSFSRTRQVPLTVLHLASGQLSLANITFFVAGDELVCEDLIIGLPVLQHLRVDTRTLLENNRPVLDDADCSAVGNPTAINRGGVVSRMMTARKIRETESVTSSKSLPGGRPRANFFFPRGTKWTRFRTRCCLTQSTGISTNRSVTKRKS